MVMVEVVVVVVGVLVIGEVFGGSGGDYLGAGRCWW